MAYSGSHSVVKTVRTNSLSRKSIAGGLTQRVQLDTVLGLTVVSNAGLAFSPASGAICYAAGSVIVIWDPVDDQQQHLIVPNKRTISALNYNSDGRFLASGECGQMPCLRIWDTKDGSQIGELNGHKNGITFVAFSPDSKFLISVGTHHDNLVIVWDWRNGRMIASNKVTCKVKGLAFSEDGSFFLTVGNRHVKYWYLETAKDSRGDVVPLVGRSAVLGEKKDELFLDAICGRGSCAEYAYAATQSGYLCQFNSRRSLEKLISLQSSAASCLSATETGIAVGSSDGNVRIYDPVHLNQIRILPHPHHLGVDVAKFNSAEQLQRRTHNDLHFPDCVALACDDARGRITVIYNDHSIYVWDIRDSRQTSKICSHMYHSRCVWGIDIFAPIHPKSSASFLTGTFFTCSSDDTVRIWNTSTRPIDSTQPNLFCSATFKVLYNDSSLQYLCNKEVNPGGVDPQDVHTDSKYGIRCVRIDPYGTNFAFGDRSGNIHIYETKAFQESYKIEAHDSEVLCLEYSNPDSGYEFLASASRDRLIQIFDVKNDYDCIQTLDDHSSSITALRFATLNGIHQFGLISCGVDKAVILRTVQYSAETGPKFLLNDQILSKGGIVYDMDIEKNSQSIVTANQDRNLRLYGIKSRKLEKTVKGTVTDEGALIKLDLHSSGRFIATSCSDKNLAVIDIISGECWASFSGHSEIVTGLRFDQESKKLISVSGDGCVFVWKIGGELTAGGAKFPDVADRAHIPLSPSSSITSHSEFSISESDVVEDDVPLRPSSLNFDDSPLPSWAKAKHLASPSLELVISKPSGKWAEDEDKGSVRSGFAQPILPISANDINGPLLAVSTGGVAWIDSSLSPAVPLKQASGSFSVRSRSSTSSVSTSSSVSENRRKENSVTDSFHSNVRSSYAAAPQDDQPKILGIIGGPRRSFRDELDEDDAPVFDSKERSLRMQPLRLEVSADGRKSPDTVRDDESVSNVSTASKNSSSPQPSRPETPSEMANKFLNLSTSGIDKAFKGRLQHRQSVTIKHGPLAAALPEQPIVTSMLSKATPGVSPSQKLIHNVKLSQARQKYKSTQNLSSGPPVKSRVYDQNFESQDSQQQMRRATSMTDLQADKTRNGLDGYNSLLERARARLSSTSAKAKSEFGSASILASLGTYRSSYSDISTLEADDISTTGSAFSTEGREEKHAFNSLLRSAVPNRDRRIRSGGSDISSSSESTHTVVPGSSSTESKNILPKTVLERRLRRNSATRSMEPLENTQSPTSSAIARIKAELGLNQGSTEPNEQNGSPIAQPKFNTTQAKASCTLLTSAVDSIIENLNQVLAEDGLGSKKDIIDIYSEALRSVRTKLDSALISTETATVTNGSSNQPVNEKSGELLVVPIRD